VGSFFTHLEKSRSLDIIVADNECGGRKGVRALSEHYFTSKPTTVSQLSQIHVTLRGRDYKLWTDAGVFSKEGVDFGSRLLVESMEIPADASVLDVGCGYGPIGIVAAHLASQGHATLIDVNERALELARKNVQANAINNVTVLQSNIYEQVQGKQYDVILSNPPIRAGKSVVHEILERAIEHLNPGGALWIVIQKKQGAPSAWNKLKEVYDEVEEMTKDKGYRIFRAKKKLTPQ
jgi:16S rRNA (guanine1207-N2)-methyltransferase